MAQDHSHTDLQHARLTLERIRPRAPPALIFIGTWVSPFAMIVALLPAQGQGLMLRFWGVHILIGFIGCVCVDCVLR